MSKRHLENKIGSKIIVPDAFLGTSVIKLFNTNKKNIYYEDIKCVLYCLRLVAKLPYSTDKNGELYTSVFWIIVSILIFASITFLGVINAIGAVTHLIESDSRFSELLLNSLSLMFLLIDFFVPLSFWLERNTMINYINEWRTFQNYLYSSTFMMGKQPECLKWKFTSIIVISVPTVILLISMETEILFTNNWYEVIPYIYTFNVYNFNLFFWMFTSCEINGISCILREVIIKITQEPNCNNKFTQIARVRSLWLQLVGLTKQLGSVVAFTTIFCMIISFSCFVASSYALISTIIEGKQFSGVTLGFAIVCCVTILYMTLLCECSHRTSVNLGTRFSSALMNCGNISLLDAKSAREIEIFLQVILLNPTDISLSGFVTINRNLATSIIGSTVTYLIVLVQFQATEV